MLVYENYSKFITATDTIRRMKANVEEMGGRMEELQACTRGVFLMPELILRCKVAPEHCAGHVHGKRGGEREAGEAPHADRGPEQRPSAAEEAAGCV